MRGSFRTPIPPMESICCAWPVPRAQTLSPRLLPLLLFISTVVGVNALHEKAGRRRSGEQELSRLPVESVDFLGARVAKQKRGIIGSHAEPDIPKTCLPEVLQIGHPLQLAVANTHSHH